MADSLFISPSTRQGLQGEGVTSLVYLYGLSDYWVNIFEDSDVIEALLEANTYQLSTVYSKFLQYTGNFSLQTIQESYNQQLKLVLIDEATVQDEVMGVSFKLSSPMANVKYLMNRPMLPTTTLENGVHFELNHAGDIITFFKPLRELPFPKRPTRQDTEEYALWATDVHVDEGMLQSQFGRLVDMTPDRAIGNYKSFLQGLYFLYSFGPNIRHIERGLNLALGLPYARLTETVLSIIQDVNTGHWIVITPTQYYDIPYGFRPELNIGDTIAAGDQLASWIEVKDYRRSGDWWLNSYIPQELLNNINSFDLGPATVGSPADFVMRNYLKNHTFQILFKQSGVSLDAYNTVKDIVTRVKPLYTFPVFVWQAPIGDEEIDLQEEFKYDLKSYIDDTIGILPISEFRRDTANTGFLRGRNWYNRFQVPGLLQEMVGDATDPMDRAAFLDTEVTLSGVGGWLPEIQYRDPYQLSWFSRIMRNRGDKIQPRLRSSGIRGYRSENVDVFEGMTWKIDGSRCYPEQQTPYLLNERMTTPLYCLTEAELETKLRKVQVAFSAARGDFQVLKGVRLKLNYETICKRDPAQELVLNDADPALEENFLFYQSAGNLNPMLSDYQTLAYMPPPSKVQEVGDLFVAKVFRDTWAVYLIQTDIIHAPTYFPVDNDDSIGMTFEFHYSYINAQRPSMINRSTAKLESQFLMNRARKNGTYRDLRSGYSLTMNRSGVYGPMDKPLRSYKGI